jgi:hypothetical protein
MVNRVDAPAHVVNPALGALASVRSAISSAAVCPCAAQCVLFCTVAKKRCEDSADAS